VGGGDFDMVERVSLQYLPTSDNFFDDNIFYRQIFPNEIGMKKKRSDNGNVDPDPDSIRSKAKRARLERAKERRQQAAEN
jgi:hypothetical protein